MTTESNSDRTPQASTLKAGTPQFSFGQLIVLAVVPRLVWALLWIMGRTWRFEVIADEGASPLPFGQKSGAEIFCFWHQCILPSNIYFRHSRSVLLISRSFDGELITRIAKRFGYSIVRGSSSQGASRGLLELKRVIKKGDAAIFTADGPRGPIYLTKPGPIKLAQISGAPINAFHLEPERVWKMRSWDQFMVPKPFTRIVLSWATVTRVPAVLTDAEFEAKREELNAAIERARLRALAHFKKAQP